MLEIGRRIGELELASSLPLLEEGSGEEERLMFLLLLRRGVGMLLEEEVKEINKEDMGD